MSYDINRHLRFSLAQEEDKFMIQASERITIAQEVLDTHAENLRSEFSTFEDLQSLFIDVFGEDVGSSKSLASLQNQFSNNTLRPEIKFVSSQVLTDDYGNIRDAAFDADDQTILLSEDLDAAGIESSIEQEIGHWWDVQLNGTKDTTTEDGKPFDEGTAYAERFNEGVQGDDSFSDLVYQSDFQTILVNGQETEIEFRPIATWNMQGGTNGGNNTWASVFELIEQKGIKIMALQEAGPQMIRQNLEAVADGAVNVTDNVIPNVNLFTFERNNNSYNVYWTNGGLNKLPVAMVVRNPSPDVEPLYADNGSFQRPVLGVRTDGKAYYSVHARSPNGSDADDILDEVLNPQIEIDNPENIFALGDFNRNIANGAADPAGNIDGVWNQQYADLLIPPNATTQNAREQTMKTLDYMFTGAGVGDGEVLINELPGAGTEQYPSDHFPVLYDDGI